LCFFDNRSRRVDFGGDFHERFRVSRLGKTLAGVVVFDEEVGPQFKEIDRSGAQERTQDLERADDMHLPRREGDDIDLTFELIGTALEGWPPRII